MSTRARELFVAAGAALVLAVLATWPVAADLGGSLPWDPRGGAFADSRAHGGPWALWHAARVVGHLENPFLAAELGSPQGTNVALEEHALAPGILALPLRLACGAVTAANLTRLLLLAAALVASFALARAAGLSRRAAVLAAAAWSFSPHHMEAGLTSLGRGAGPFLPLLWLAVLRLSAGRHGRSRGGVPPRQSLRLAAGAGLAAAGVLWSSPIAGPPALLATALLWLVAPALEPVRTRGRPAGAHRSVPWILFGVLLGSAALPWGLAAKAAEADRQPVESLVTPGALDPSSEREASTHSSGNPVLEPAVRALDFFAPPALHPLLRKDGVPTLGSRGSGLAPSPSPSLFPGLAVLVLALCSALYSRGARRWLLLGVLLGCATWDPGCVLGRALGSLPAVGRGLATPGAFFPAMHLAVALAAGCGFDSLRRQAGGASLAVLIAVLLPFELLALPYPTHRTWVPAPVEAIATWPGEGAVCVLPLADPVAAQPPALQMVAEALTWQTVHGRPTTFGWVAEPDPGVARLRASLVPDLVRLGIGLGVPDAEGLALDLSLLRTDHLLLRTGASVDVRAAIASLDQIPGWTRAPLEDDGVLWWFRSATLQETGRSAVALDLGQ